MTDGVDITERMVALMDSYEYDQTQLAAAWREQWNARDGEREVAESTVTTRLSNLRNGKVDGVGFFFKDRHRGRLLLSLLGVAEEDHAEIFDAADAKLEGRTPSRLLVLLALEPGLPDPAMWTRLRQWLQAPQTPSPVLLCVNDAQYDTVPHSLIALDEITLETVDTDAARTRASEVVEQGGLVATSAWGLAPFEHWLAVDFTAEGEALACAPSGWRARWRAEGRLEALPEPAHRLDGLDFGPADEPPALQAGPALHAHLLAIATGDSTVEPPVRLAHAAQLGVIAGARDDEVRAFQVREEDRRLSEAAEGAGSPSETVDAAGLEALLTRANVRRLEAVRRVGDHWHWINVEPPETFAEHQRVTVHRLDTPEPALARLWAAVHSWTAEDLAADPMLRAVSEQLDPDDEEKAAFDLARAWIRESDWKNWPRPSARATSKAPADMEAALRALVTGPAVETTLRLRPTDDSHWTTQDVLARWQDEGIGVYRKPPRGPIDVHRGQKVLQLRGRRNAVSGNRVLLPVEFLPKERVLGADALDPFCERLLTMLDPQMSVRWTKAHEHKALWTKLIEHCTERDYYGRRRLKWAHHALRRNDAVADRIRAYLGHLPDPNDAPAWFEGLPLRLERHQAHISTITKTLPSLWTRADHFIAQLRRTLRARLADSDCATLAGQALLLPLRRGVDAQVELQEVQGDEHAARVELPVDGSTQQLVWSTTLRRSESTTTANQPWAELDRTPPLDLPPVVELVAGGVMARITFVPDLACTGPTDETVARIEATVKTLDDQLKELTTQVSGAREEIAGQLADIKERLRFV